MSRTILQGRLAHRLRSLAVLMGTSLAVLGRRAIGRPLLPQWSATFEIGTLFFRHQFNHALALPGIAEGRAYFDSLQTVAEDRLAVDVRPSAAGEPPGHWFTPRGATGPWTLLYLHGGGYAFYAAVTRHFIAMLAQTLQVRIFAPDYRLTPEHPHPAQRDDALAAYRHLLQAGVSPAQMVVAGDSAGGHLSLMLAAALRPEGLPQPALFIGLSPWTDIGRRGASQFGNDRYDMVQGYQTLRYGQWLKGHGTCTDAELSPIAQRFDGVAPIYLQAGGKEILVDMIRDFARVVQAQGAPVRLDVWPDMTHEFHAYGRTLPQSREALHTLREVIAWATAPQRQPPPPRLPHTEVESFAPAGGALAPR